MRVLVSEEGPARCGHNRGRAGYISIATMTLVGGVAEDDLQSQQRYGSTGCNLRAESGALRIYVGRWLLEVHSTRTAKDH
jgi:hypothetical protein